MTSTPGMTPAAGVGDPPIVPPRKKKTTTSGDDGRMNNGAPLSVSSLHTSLMKKIERLSIIIDDSLESETLVPSLCSNVQRRYPVGDDDHRRKHQHESYETDATAANSSAEYGNEDSLDSGPEVNFASWLASREFDASAIVWNGDDNNPQDMSMELDGAPPSAMAAYNAAAAARRRHGGDDDDGRPGDRSRDTSWGHGYVSLPDGKRQRGRDMWLSDAWERMASTGLQCWQGASGLGGECRSKIAGARMGGSEKRGRGMTSELLLKSKEYETADRAEQINRPEPMVAKSPPNTSKIKKPLSILKKSSFDGRPKMSVFSRDEDEGPPPNDDEAAQERKEEDEAAAEDRDGEAGTTIEPLNLEEEAPSQVASSYVSSYVSSYTPSHAPVHVHPEYARSFRAPSSSQASSHALSSAPVHVHAPNPNAGKNPLLQPMITASDLSSQPTTALASDMSSIATPLMGEDLLEDFSLGTPRHVRRGSGLAPGDSSVITAGSCTYSASPGGPSVRGPASAGLGLDSSIATAGSCAYSASVGGRSVGPDISAAVQVGEQGGAGLPFPLTMRDDDDKKTEDIGRCGIPFPLPMHSDLEDDGKADDDMYDSDTPLINTRGLSSDGGGGGGNNNGAKGRWVKGRRRRRLRLTKG